MSLASLFPSFNRQLAGQFMLGTADLIEQFVECFGSEFLTRCERSQDIDQEQPYTEDLGQRTIRALIVGGRCASQLVKDEAADQFAGSCTHLATMAFEGSHLRFVEFGSCCLQPKPCTLGGVFGKLFITEKRHSFPLKTQSALERHKAL